MKFAFAGTPEFAARVLSDLCELGCRPSLVITQPSRPQGRGRCCRPSAVFRRATELGLRAVEAENINAGEVMWEIGSAGAEALVVAAFGQMLGRALLDSVLCLNVHASLLPAYRGAAPIERALMSGEKRTGVSIMLITDGLDEGPVGLQSSVSISLRDDAGSLGRVLALMGAVGVRQALEGIADGTLKWQEQVGPTTYAPKLRSGDCLLDVSRGARSVHDQVRALSPRMGARAQFGEVEVKLWRTWPYGESGLDPVPAEAMAAANDAGRVVATRDRLFVGCAQGVLDVFLVQPAGRNKMTCPEFLRGYRARLGDRLVGGSTCRSEPGTAGMVEDKENA